MLEVFEQDMVGAKGFVVTTLEGLTRHKLRIVSKVSNANTIPHSVDASLKVLRRVGRDLVRRYRSAEVSSRTVSMAAVVGRDLSGLSVLTRGLQAIAGAGLDAIGASQGQPGPEPDTRNDIGPRAACTRARLARPGGGV